MNLKYCTHLWRIAGVFALAALMTGSSVQGAPLEGYYTSVVSHPDPDYIEGVEEGRWSESYYGGGPLQVGNTINVESWASPELASQWILTGPFIPTGGIDGDTGVVTYDTSTTTMLLKDTGPWWDDDDSPGLTEYNVDVTLCRRGPFLSSQLDDPYGMITVEGEITGFAQPYNVEFFLAVTYEHGEGSLPAGYPAYLPETWQGDDGHWGVVQMIQMQITPEPATLALVALGGLGVLARRRRRR